MPEFDPFASGSATAVAEQGKEFDPFATGTAAAEVPMLATNEPNNAPDIGTNWPELYRGINREWDNVLTPKLRAAFQRLDAVSDNSNDARMQAVNQAYLSTQVPEMSHSYLERNWPTVRDAYANTVLGIPGKNITDTKLYSEIATQRFAEAMDNPDSAEAKQYLAWKSLDFTDPRAPDTFWEALNKPVVDLPEAPKDLPDLPQMGMSNPALVGGVWNAVKPLVEGVESPLGIATLGIGARLKAAGETYPLARQALAAMTGIFTGIMGWNTGKHIIAAPKVLNDPNASFQEKVEAVVSPAADAAVTILGAVGTALELFPKAKGAAVVKELEGKNPAQAAEILRREAVDTDIPGHSDFLDHAAAELERIASIKDKEAVDIGKRDASVSTGTGVETPHEEAMMAEWKKAIAEELGTKPTSANADVQQVPKEPAPGGQAEAGVVSEMPRGGSQATAAGDAAGTKPRDSGALGIKNAAIDAELEKMGLPKATHDERVTFKGELEKAAKIAEADPEAPKRLIDSLAEKSRPITGTEDALLLRELNRVRLERDAAEADFIGASTEGDAADMMDAKLRIAQARDAFQKVSDVVTKVGTQNAQGLALRRMMIKEDYSLAALERRRVVANRGKPLTEAQVAEVRELHKKLFEAQRRIDLYENQRLAAQAEPVKEAPSRKPPTSKAREFLTEQAKQARERIKARNPAHRFHSGPIDTADLVDHAIIGAEYIAKGVTKFAEWSVAMVNEFGDAVRPHLQEIFKQAIYHRDIVESSRLLELRKTKLIESIKELQKRVDSGDLSTKPEKPNRPAVEEIEKLEQQRDNLRAELQGMRETAEKVKNLQEAIAEKERKISSGDLSPKETTKNRPASETVEKLSQQRDALNKELAEARKEVAKPTEKEQIERRVEAINKQIVERRKVLQSGNLTPKANPQNRPQIRAIEEARQELERINAKIAEARKGPPKDPYQRSLEAYKTRTATATTKLNEKLASGDTTRAERKPLKLDAEAIRLRTEYERAKRKVDLSIQEAEAQTRGPVEKARDAFQKWVRLGALSYPTVFVKLTSAAVARLVGTPLEQFAGLGISKLLPELAERARMESVPTTSGLVRAESKALVEGITTGMKAAWDMLHNRDSDLTALLEKEHLPPGFVDYLGKLHGAFKAPAQVADFARRLQLITEADIRKGLDVTHPVEQMRLMHEAWAYSKRAIFMQDNGVVNAYKAALRMLEAKQKATGKPSAWLQAMSTAIQAELPIVKVPTNVVSEIFEVVTGALQGPARAAWAYAKGIENLSPGEADQILRLIKKGAIGAAFLALGYFKAKQFGGFHQSGDKHKEGKLQPGEIKVDGVTVPRMALHNPYMEAAQYAATVRRVSEEMVKGAGGDAKGPLPAVLGATIGLLDEVPFVRETTTLGRYADTRQVMSAIDAKAASVLIPGLVQWAAAQHDKKTPFSPLESPRARKSTTLPDYLKKGTPLLREELPRKR